MTSDKREKAIKYLTEEIRSLRMAPKINGCGPENWAEQLEVMETCLEAVRSVHFADAGKMQPLTLEQLREMDGQPVWIVEQPDWGHWELSEDADDYFSDRDPGLYGLTYPDPEGKGGIHKLGWIAYAYPPPHIDREAWVNVRERLPEKEGWYLVYAPGYHGNSHIYGLSGLAYSKFDPNYKRHWGIERGTGGGWAGIITHWMPLPEPPDELEKRLRG